MREYRYYYLGGLIFSTVGFYLLYEFDVLTENDFLWPTAVWSPLFALTILSFINFAGPEDDNTYNEVRVAAVKKSASTPVKILQSPVLWLGIISVGVILSAFIL